MRDLTALIPASLGVVLVDATGINDAGTLIAIGRDGGHADGHGDHEFPVRVLLLQRTP